MFIPKANVPTEANARQKWVVDKILELLRKQDEWDAAMGRLTKQSSAAARQTNALSFDGGDGGGNVPLPALTGAVLRGQGPDRPPRWTYEWQGLLPRYYVFMQTGFSSYSNDGMGLSESYVTDAAIAQRLLPPVEFADSGRTMLPIDMLNYADSASNPYTGAGQAPFDLFVDVYPTEEGEEFTIHLPPATNANGSTTPFYVFGLRNSSAEFSATVNIAETNLFYPLSNVPVNGDVDTWVLEPSYLAGWHVTNVIGFGTAAMPGSYVGTGGAVFSSDPYYQANFWS